jgi:hypothetical protein
MARLSLPQKLEFYVIEVLINIGLKIVRKEYDFFDHHFFHFLGFALKAEKPDSAI